MYHLSITSIDIIIFFSFTVLLIVMKLKRLRFVKLTLLSSSIFSSFEISIRSPFLKLNSLRIIDSLVILFPVIMIFDIWCSTLSLDKSLLPKHIITLTVNKQINTTVNLFINFC